MPRSSSRSPLASLPPFDPHSGDLFVVIETPAGSRNKFKYDPQHGLFKLSGVMPVGSTFPFDFGYIPSTIAEDGDPIDVLLLLDAPTFVGCLVPARLIGVIEAEQVERDGTKVRNDRLLAVACKSRHHEDVSQLGQLSESLLAEIENFFVSYNVMAGKEFVPLGRKDERRARQLVDEATQRKTGSEKV